ncbi:MAG: reverse transcriptase/maturase family protein [Patescibacteria group bacterium]
MSKKSLIKFSEISNGENLLAAWREFIIGKKNKKDVIKFSLHLGDNILQLQVELANGSYQHGGYQDFYVSDPKLRHIHKASVRDRLVHHAVCRQLYPFFSQLFIAHSYSCQLGKGTHRAGLAFRRASGKVSLNKTRTVWVLQADIKRFFDSIDQEILIVILRRYIDDERIMSLLENIIRSFSCQPGKGLPLGNLTSQLFVNIYLNEFDQFVKNDLKVKYYFRYADDFAILSDNCDYLSDKLTLLEGFLRERLKLELHPTKLHLKTLASGVDFLGHIYFPDYYILRTKTRRRMLRKMSCRSEPANLASYLGLLSSGQTFNLRKRLLDIYWLYSD